MLIASRDAFSLFFLIIMSETFDIDVVIDKLLEVRGARAGKARKADRVRDKDAMRKGTRGVSESICAP